MKVINAEWELRNIGVSTQEVEIDINDTLEDIETTLNSLAASYQVVKVSSSRLDVYSFLCKQGFNFVEGIINITHNLKTIQCPKLVARLSKDLSYELMNKADVTEMQANIRNGMFRTDRIALDPCFSLAQAANRYICWINDEVERGAKLYKYVFKNQAIGFVCVRETEEDIYYPVLGGVYQTGKMLPFGSVVILKQLDIIKDLNGKAMYTYISTNNPPVMKAYSQCGYIFNEVKNVFVKHI